MRGLHAPVSIAFLAVLAGTVAACGGGGAGGRGEAPAPPARPQGFPAAKGRSLRELTARVGAQGPVLAPAVTRVDPGSARVGFGLFDRARAQIAAAPVALYWARRGGGPAAGPYPARYESLTVDSRFRGGAWRPDAPRVRSLYVSRARFPGPGSYDVVALARLDDRLVVATAERPLVVARKDPVPPVGARAPRVRTRTLSDVAGDAALLDSRRPPSTMHDADLAAVLGRRPVVLIFSSVGRCATRVCAPVLDVAEQVKARTPADVAWVHQELYAGDGAGNALTAQARRYGLDGGPWLFAIDRRGRIVARIEGAFGAPELEAAIAKARSR